MLKDFEVYRSADVRERRTFEKRRGKIVSFRVQLEVLVGNEWKAIKRWDTSHGFVDCDIYNLKGEKKKIILNVSFEDGLVLAQKDFNEHWRLYRDRFLQGVFP